jgi:RNA polymerase sigma-70 factor (ECF subfamily)
MIGNLPPPAGNSPQPSTGNEEQLVIALRNGDERAFATLIDRYHMSLTRLAMAHISDRTIAEEIVQETWLALVRGIDRFEGRSSLKTWLFRVLSYQVRQRLGIEQRSVPFAVLTSPTVDPARFLPDGHRLQGHWAEDLPSLDGTPEEVFLAQETMNRIATLIEKLPPRQRVVIVMRDVEGMSAGEVCDILSMNDGTQRVLLHRARATLREGIATYILEGHSSQ